MKEQAQMQQQESRTIQSKTRASNQANAKAVLQRYAPAQREALPDEDELLQGKFETAQLMDFEDEEPSQGKFETTQLMASPFDGGSGAAENDTGLPDNLKAGIENLSGYSMDDVRVHYNSAKPAQLQAHAYTQGTNIHVAPGQEQHLAHEAWHVVQQKQGRVQPTMQLQGVNINDNVGLEKEADVMGNMALQRKVHGSVAQKKATTGDVVQRVSMIDEIIAIGKIRKKRAAVFHGDIESTVFYGHTNIGVGPRDLAEAGYRYYIRQQNREPGHTSVDKLNKAIGLSDNTLKNVGMEVKRARIRAALNYRGGLTPDENEWVGWLKGNCKNALLMPEMNGEQCREDMKMNTVWGKRGQRAKRHKIKNSHGTNWIQENHTNNVPKNLNVAKSFMLNCIIPVNDKNAHDRMVNYANRHNWPQLIEQLNEQLNEQQKEQIGIRTQYWLEGPVMMNFWRITSLAGLDFFNYLRTRQENRRNIGVDFVRGADERDYDNGNRVRAITDSEWEHAIKQGYVNPDELNARERRFLPNHLRWPFYHLRRLFNQDNFLVTRVAPQQR